VLTAASLRFTLAAVQWCSTVGSTATAPLRAGGGSRGQAKNEATASRSLVMDGGR
jgi:hypothetical protein